MKKVIVPIIISFIIIASVAGMFLYKKNTMAIESRKAGEKITIELENGLLLDLTYIPQGAFYMGSAEGIGDEDELPVRKVEITNGFYMGTCEVTNAQWQAVMGTMPSTYTDKDVPAPNVSYNHCPSSCTNPSELSGYNVSLPTAAQWEYACRGGTDTKWFFGDSEDDFYKYASLENANGPYSVATYEPNQYGLYDMYGNVMEWCEDYYAANYDVDDLINPTGPETGTSRVLRGGGWGESPDYCRSAYRNASGEDNKTDGIGFRIIIFDDMINEK